MESSTEGTENYGGRARLGPPESAIGDRPQHPSGGAAELATAPYIKYYINSALISAPEASGMRPKVEGKLVRSHTNISNFCIMIIADEII